MFIEKISTDNTLLLIIIISILIIGLFIFLILSDWKVALILLPIIMPFVAISITYFISEFARYEKVMSISYIVISSAIDIS